MPTPKGFESKNRGKRFPGEVLTRAEIAALVRSCDCSTEEGLRDRALIAVLYRAGLRVSEALALFPKDVRADGAITVMHGKGGKRRLVGLDALALRMVATWLAYKAERGVPGTFPIFGTTLHASRPMLRTHAARLIRRRGEKAGILRRVHPHALRHTFATECAQEGQSMLAIKQQLGHASLQTTQKYLERIAPEWLIKTVAARSWDPSEGVATPPPPAP